MLVFLVNIMYYKPKLQVARNIFPLLYPAAGGDIELKKAVFFLFY